MKLPPILLIAASMCVTLPTNAEMADLKNPAWREVPGTKVDGEPMQIDMNGIVRNGSVLTSDITNSDPGYARVETNCKTGQLRTVRMGFFESQTQVNYGSLKNPWSKPNSAYQRALVAFVCSLK